MQAQKQGDDFIQNFRGDLVRKSNYSDMDLLRHQTTVDLSIKAKRLSAIIESTKQTMFNDLAAYAKLLAEKYGVFSLKVIGTHKSICENYKIVVQTQEFLSVSGNVEIAKQLLNEWLNDEANEATENMQAVIDSTFKIHSGGKLSARRIQELIKVNLPKESEKWKRAIDALKSSIVVSGSSFYMNFYERVGANGVWQPVSLNFAATPVYLDLKHE